MQSTEQLFGWAGQAAMVDEPRCQGIELAPSEMEDDPGKHDVEGGEEDVPHTKPFRAVSIQCDSPRSNRVVTTFSWPSSGRRRFASRHQGDTAIRSQERRWYLARSEH